MTALFFLYKPFILLTTYWLLYCLLHSILASNLVKNYFQKNWGSLFGAYKTIYSIIALILLIVIISYQKGIKELYLFAPPVIISIIASLLSLSGIVLMCWCIYIYFREQSGMNWLFKNSGPSSLKVTGIHQFVRHPLYLATFLFIWGGWILFPFLSLLISNCIITLYTLIGINLEENKLLKEYGEGYRNYQLTVPKIIPHLRFHKASQD